MALRVSATLDEGLIASKLALVDFPQVASPVFLDRYGRPGMVKELTGVPFFLIMLGGQSQDVSGLAIIPMSRTFLILWSCKAEMKRFFIWPNGRAWALHFSPIGLSPMIVRLN